MRNTKIYVAGRYGRRGELLQKAITLESFGWTVTSRWLAGKEEERPSLKSGDNGDETIIPIKAKAIFATNDLADIDEASNFIAFTEAPNEGPPRGGRHVELGYALATGKRIIVIGYRENVFCCLERVEFYETFDDALKHLRIEVG